MAHLIHDLAQGVGPRQRAWQCATKAPAASIPLQPALPHWCSRSQSRLKSRTVVWRSTNDFRQSFNSPEPGRSNRHGEDSEDAAPQERLGPAGYLTPERYQAVGDELSPYAQDRIADLVATPTGELLLQEAALLQEESRRWPRFDRDETGQWHFYPGFFLRILEVLPPEFILANAFERLCQLLVFAAYTAAAVLAAQYAFAANYNLGLALTITWMRDRLSLSRLLVICALAWFQKLWLYWVFFVGARIDDLLKRIAPPIRTFAWVMFGLWIVYLVFSPAWHHPTPWFIFAQGNDPYFRGYPLLRQ